MASKAHHIDSPQAFTLQEFRSTLNAHKELADSCRFAVQILRKDNILTKDLTYLCHETEIPGRALTIHPFRYYGPNFNMPTKSEYQTIDFSFIVREYMAERYYFDAWMDIINPKNTYDFAYRDSYQTEVHIFQLSGISTGNSRQPIEATYKLTLRNAYPISVGAIPVSWEEDSYHKLKVTFTYTDWYNSEENLEQRKFKLAGGSSSGPPNRGKINDLT